jgi:transposase InsO family protein
MIDAFSRWVELFPTKNFGRFGTPDVIHADQGPAFRNELFSELARMSEVEHSFATAYSKEENGIVERTNQEVMRHLCAMVFDARVHDKWSFEQLPMV